MVKRNKQKVLRGLTASERASAKRKTKSLRLFAQREITKVKKIKSPRLKAMKSKRLGKQVSKKAEGIIRFIDSKKKKRRKK